MIDSVLLVFVVVIIAVAVVGNKNQMIQSKETHEDCNLFFLLKGEQERNSVDSLDHEGNLGFRGWSITFVDNVMRVMITGRKMMS